MRNIVLLIGLAGLLPAQTPDPNRSAGLFNCRGWNQQPDVLRAVYVVAFIDGLLYGPNDSKAVNAAVPEAATYGEMVKGATEVCASPANAKLTVADALFIFKLKFEGRSAANIESVTSETRRLRSH